MNKISIRKIIAGVFVGVLLVVGTAFIVDFNHNSQFKVIYSLDKRQNDQEIIKLINNANKYVYFAIYYFTKDNIADALIRAKKRGLIVEGIMDNIASRDSNKNVYDKLLSAGITVSTQKHVEGIMHMKVLVTDKAFASGSYNWTASATNINDEILEISTNNNLRKKYLAIIKKVLLINAKNTSHSSNSNSLNGTNDQTNTIDHVTSDDVDNDVVDLATGIPEYNYIEALNHIGERAIVKGKVLKVFTSKSGVTFLDYCESFSDCPFSAVIFASDLKKFPDIKKFERAIEITGIIKSYNGKAEIILNNPNQIKLN